VNSVAISSDNKYIVSGSDDYSIRVWERESGTQIQELKGHNSLVNSVTISKDNKLIVSGSSDKTIRVWERESGFQIQELKGHD
jgi:WD40 repeat protein